MAKKYTRPQAEDTKISVERFCRRALGEEGMEHTLRNRKKDASRTSLDPADFYVGMHSRNSGFNSAFRELLRAGVLRARTHQGERGPRL